MKISIVILSYNDYSGTTSPCLASLAKDPAFTTWDVIIVDNASDATTRELLQQAQTQYPAVRFIFNENNIGYAAGNNVGIRLTTGEVVILLNSDTEAPVGMIEKLAHHFVGNPKLGMIGPVTNAAGNEQAILVSAETIAEKIEQGLRYANSGGNELLETYRMDFHCVAIAREVINTVGLLDEEFGRGYYEDFDYSLRVKQAGYDLRVAEDVFIYHRGSASFGKLPLETKALMKRNKKRMISKHGSKIKFLHLRDGNLSILNQYAERKDNGKTLSDYRISQRFEFALAKQPRSFFKKWRYLNRVKKIAGRLSIKNNL
jgi:GT2 family glycosyltransferase